MKTDYRPNMNPPPTSAHGSALTAMRIALAFAHSAPTVPALRERFGMSRATAYRWVASYKIAKGAV